MKENIRFQFHTSVTVAVNRLMSSHRLRFSDKLEDHMSADAVEQTLHAAIDLGRYAEHFAYDDQTRVFSLDNP